MNDHRNTDEPCPHTVRCFKSHGRLLFAMDVPFANVTPPLYILPKYNADLKTTKDRLSHSAGALDFPCGKVLPWYKDNNIFVVFKMGEK